MASMFPNPGSSGDSSEVGLFNRDRIIFLVTQTQEQVKTLKEANGISIANLEKNNDIRFTSLEKAMTSAITELRRSVEEMVDRFQTELEEFQKILPNYGDLKNNNHDLDRRVKGLEEGKVETEKRLKILEELVIQGRTLMWAAGLIGSLIGGSVAFIANKIWK